MREEADALLGDQNGSLPCPLTGDAAITWAVTRGVRRHLATLGQSSLTEVTLKGGRRADIMAIDGKGEITIVEVKVSVADLRGDRKWPDYQDWCDGLYFAVPLGFNQELVPEETGLIVADGYSAAILRPAPMIKLSAARRKAVILRFARLATQRLHRLEDPGATVDGGSAL